MRRALGLLALAAATAAVASAARTDPGHRALELKAPPTPHSLLAFRGDRRTTWLVRVDPRTLRYRKGRKLDITGYGSGWSFSPDGSLLALGDRTFGRVLLVDPARLRVLRLIQTGMFAHVSATAWLGDRLIIVLVECCEPGHETTVVTVGPTFGHVLSRVDLAGSLERAARTRSELVLVLGPAEGVGPSRLVVADAEGRVRTAGIDRIHSGRESEIEGYPTVRHARPGLAVDPASRRAFVVGSGSPVAAVDLRSLAVDYHALAAPVSLLTQVRDWLEPAAHAKVPPTGPVRTATWLGEGLIAVSGYDSHAWPASRDRIDFRATPAGLKVIDTHDWSVHTLDPTATSFEVADKLLLASAWIWDSTRPRASGKGFTAYDANGAVRFHLFGSKPVIDVRVVGQRALVHRDGGGTALVDLRKGRVLRVQQHGPPALVLGAKISEH